MHYNALKFLFLNKHYCSYFLHIRFSRSNRNCNCKEWLTRTALTWLEPRTLPPASPNSCTGKPANQGSQTKKPGEQKQGRRSIPSIPISCDNRRMFPNPCGLTLLSDSPANAANPREQNADSTPKHPTIHLNVLYRQSVENVEIWTTGSQQDLRTLKKNRFQGAKWK